MTGFVAFLEGSDGTRTIVVQAPGRRVAFELARSSTMVDEFVRGVVESSELVDRSSSQGEAPNAGADSTVLRVWRYGATRFAVRDGGTTFEPGPIVAGPFSSKREAVKALKRARKGRVEL